jgi:hypothetical protein
MNLFYSVSPQLRDSWSVRLTDILKHLTPDHVLKTCENPNTWCEGLDTGLDFSFNFTIDKHAFVHTPFLNLEYVHGTVSVFQYSPVTEYLCVAKFELQGSDGFTAQNLLYSFSCKGNLESILKKQ